jgi:cytochrome b subunit of formate dehydrogenase
MYSKARNIARFKDRGLSRPQSVDELQAQERLRQERETFEHRRVQDARWFRLRLAMGWAAAILLPAIAAVSGWIVLHEHGYSVYAIGVATTALLVDAFGMLISIWKIVVGRGPDGLAPVTGESLPPSG